MLSNHMYVSLYFPHWDIKPLKCQVQSIRFVLAYEQGVTTMTISPYTRHHEMRMKPVYHFQS